MGVRMLLKNPGSALAAIITRLGAWHRRTPRIFITSAAVCLKPLPYQDPQNGWWKLICAA